MPCWRNALPCIQTGKCSCGSFAIRSRSWSCFRDALTMVTELMGWYFNIGTSFLPRNVRIVTNPTCSSVDEIRFATLSLRRAPSEEPLNNRRRMVRTFLSDHPSIFLISFRRTHRRLFNQAFNVKASRKYEPQELTGTHALLARLLSAPEGFMHHFRQYVQVYSWISIIFQADVWS
jgi:hypothetical protein